MIIFKVIKLINSRLNHSIYELNYKLSYYYYYYYNYYN